MEKTLKSFLREHNFKYEKINNFDSLKKICDLCINNIIFEPITVIEIHYLGFYYQHFNKNIDLMKKYYKFGIEKSFMLSLKNLRKYFDNNNKWFEKIETFIEYQQYIPREYIIKSFIDYWNNLSTKDDQNKFCELVSNFEFNETDDISLQLQLFIKTLQQKLSITKLHFEYSVNGKGYDDAKQDFINKVAFG